MRALDRILRADFLKRLSLQNCTFSRAADFPVTSMKSGPQLQAAVGLNSASLLGNLFRSSAFNLQCFGGCRLRRRQPRREHAER